MTEFAKFAANHSGPVRKGQPMSFFQVLAERERPVARAQSFNSLMSVGIEGMVARRKAPHSAVTAATLSVTKTAVDEEQRIVRGWASVATKGGETVTDLQNDQIAIEALTKAAHAFIAGSRASLKNHAGKPVGTVVESMIFDRELQDALGVDAGAEGWLIAVHVVDDATWAEVKKGALMSFSIGGSATVEA
jgi:hypothetical protein